MKKLLTLTLSLFMALSLCLTISAEDEKYFEINGQKYSTLSDALSAVSDNTETTIKLIKDYETSDAFDVASNKDIVLDLNGNDLEITRINCSGKLRIKNSDAENGGIEINDTSHSSSDAHIKAKDGGTFILESGNIYSSCNSEAFLIAANGNAYENNPIYSKVVINGGAIQSKENSVGAVGYGATVEVNGGAIIAQSKTFDVATGATKNQINVTGGKFYQDISEYLTDRYKTIKSTYNEIVVYEVVKNDANEETTNTTNTTSTSTKSYDAKDKNKDGIISCEEEMGNANWVWSESKQACVYKVTNTSVK